MSDFEKFKEQLPSKENLYSSLTGQKSSKKEYEHDLKGNARLIFLCNPQKSSANVCLIKILKSTVRKKVIVCFNSLGEENF